MNEWVNLSIRAEEAASNARDVRAPQWDTQNSKSASSRVSKRVVRCWFEPQLTKDRDTHVHQRPSSGHRYSVVVVGIQQLRPTVFPVSECRKQIPFVPSDNFAVGCIVYPQKAPTKRVEENVNVSIFETQKITRALVHVYSAFLLSTIENLIRSTSRTLLVTLEWIAFGCVHKLYLDESDCVPAVRNRNWFDSNVCR